MRCPYGTIWAIHAGTVILNFLNGRLHDVFNKHLNINLKLIKVYLNIQIKLY